MQDKKKDIDKSEKNEQVKAGKAAIAINRKVSKKGKSEDQKNKEEEEDSEKWRNEG